MPKAVKSAGSDPGFLTGRAPPGVVVHGLEHALAAAAAAVAVGVRIRLLSADGAAGFAGPGWFAALEARVRAAHPDAALEFVLDCAEAPGHALAALRQGVRLVRLAGDRRAVAAVASIAAATGAAVDRRRGPTLDLAGVRDPAAACAALLSGGGGATGGRAPYIEK